MVAVLLAMFSAFLSVKQATAARPAVTTSMEHGYEGYPIRGERYRPDPSTLRHEVELHIDSFAK